MGKKVIIFTQAYNAEKTIRRAIDSILNQTSSDFVFYVCDNGSIDSTRSIILEYADKDSRILPILRDTNFLISGCKGVSPFFSFVNDILKNISGKYFTYMDADDEYKLNFIEQAVSLAESENLDAVLCGYEKVDAVTNTVLKDKALNYNLLLSGDDFANRFIEYRGFTPFLWSKLYNKKLITENFNLISKLKWSICRDSISVLFFIKDIKRAGIIGESMYKYYQYPSSLSKHFNKDVLEGYDEYWRQTKEFIKLKSNGNISKLNEDFLYAIYLSMIEDILNLIFADSSINLSQKSIYISDVFNDKLAGLTFTREADPIFQNLSNRKEFLISVINRINSCFSGEDANVGKTLELINKIKSGIPK